MQISWLPQFVERLNTTKGGRSTMPNVRLEIASLSDKGIFVSSMIAGSFRNTDMFFSDYKRVASAKASTLHIWSIAIF